MYEKWNLNENFPLVTVVFLGPNPPARKHHNLVFGDTQFDRIFLSVGFLSAKEEAFVL